MAEPEKQDLVAEYDLGDAPATSGAAVAQAAAASPAPGRDEGSGRFTKSARLVRLAKDAGLSDDEIAETPAAELRGLVQEVTLERLSQRRQGAFDQATDRSLGAAAGATQPAPAAPAAAEGVLGLKEEDWDPQIYRALQSLHTELEAAKAQLARVSQFQQARVQESVAAVCDRAFAKHEAILGKERGSALKSDDPHLVRRKAVLSVAQTLPPGGSLEERIEKAVAVLFPQAAPAAPPQPGPTPAAREAPREPARNGAAQDKPAVTEDLWRSGGLARPTQRGGAPELEAGPRKAEESVRQFFEGQEGRDRQAPTVADEFPS